MHEKEYEVDFPSIKGQWRVFSSLMYYLHVVQWSIHVHVSV